MDGDESPCKRTKVDGTLKKKSTLYEMGITQYLTPNSYFTLIISLTSVIPSLQNPIFYSHLFLHSVIPCDYRVSIFTISQPTLLTTVSPTYSTHALSQQVWGGSTYVGRHKVSKCTTKVTHC